MPVALISPTTAASNSADFTVTGSTAVSVGLYTAAGGGMAGDVSVGISRKNPAGTYQSTGLVVSGAVPNVVVAAPGVYRAEKPATAVAVGVVTD